MINVVALWVLLSSVGAAILMSPETLVATTAPGDQHPLKAAKEATKESLHFAAEAARQTGEGIRKSVSSASHYPGKAAETVQRKAGEVAQTVKDGSQAGLEKIGLASHKDEPSASHFEQWETGLQDSKERAAALKDAAAYSVENTKQGVQDSYNRYFGKEEEASPTHYSDTIKEKVAFAYDATKDATGEIAHAANDKGGRAVGAVKDTVVNAGERMQDGAHAVSDKAAQATNAVKDTVVNTGERIQDGAHATYKSAKDVASAASEKLSNPGERIRDGSYSTYQSAQDAAVAAKDGVSSAAGYGQQKVSDSAAFVNDLASQIVMSVQEYINVAGAKVSGTTGSAYDRAADGLHDAATRTKRFVGVEEKPPTYQEKIQQATEQAAEILRSRGKEAAAYLPNVGQGVSYGSLNPSENFAVGDYVGKAGEYVDGAKSTAGSYYQGAKDKVTGAGAPATRDWREEFLSKVGIKSEKDLSNKDILIGNFQGMYSGGVFQKAGDYLSSAATATVDAVNSVGDKASETISNAGEAVWNTKESAVDSVNQATGKMFDRSGSTENVMQINADDPKKGTASSAIKIWEKVSAVSAVWILSSCRAAHLFSFASAYGTSLWVTFISGYLLSRTIPRHQFGFVQSKVFPAYLKLVALGQATCLVSYLILHPWSRAGAVEKFQYLDLWAILLFTLTNVFFLEPRATKVMFEKMKLEKEEGKGQDGVNEVEDAGTKARLSKVNNAFHTLHGYSSLVNLFGLMGMTWHLCHLAENMNV